MIYFSKHFSSPEFEKDGPIPPYCVGPFVTLCQEILEPVREKYGELIITSGYRPPEANAAAHGQPNSEHIADHYMCAADFYSPNVTTRALFDYLRNDPLSPYHQLIYEHGENTDVVHVSYNQQKTGTRSVLEGATHNSRPYIAIEHVAYQPPPAELNLQGDA